MLQTTFNFLDAIAKENITIEECFFIWMNSEDTTDIVISVTSRELIKRFPDRPACKVVSTAKKIRGWMIVSLPANEQDALRVSEDERVARKQFDSNSPIHNIRIIARNVNRKLDARFEKLLDRTYGNPELFAEAPQRGMYALLLYDN